MKRNQLEELKDGLGDAHKRVRSAIVTLDSCSELLNQTNYDYRVISDKLNVCKNDLIEFIRQLEFYKAIAKEESEGGRDEFLKSIYKIWDCRRDWYGHGGGGGGGGGGLFSLFGGPVVLAFCVLFGVVLGTGVGVIDRVWVDSSSSSGNRSWAWDEQLRVQN